MKGTLVAGMHDVHTTLQYAERGLLKPICEVWPFERIGEAVEKLKKSQVAGRICCDQQAACARIPQDEFLSRFGHSRIKSDKSKARLENSEYCEISFRALLEMNSHDRPVELLRIEKL